MSSVIIAGDTSGTITLTAPAVAGSGVLTLPVATDTLVGKATTDTLTNKTLTGAVINGTVGATTPTTGAFTTLSATGIANFGTNAAGSQTFPISLGYQNSATVPAVQYGFNALSNSFAIGTVNNGIAIGVASGFSAGDTISTILIKALATGAVTIPGTLAAGATTVTGDIITTGSVQIKANGSDSGFAIPALVVGNVAANQMWAWQLGASNDLRLYNYTGVVAGPYLTVATTGVLVTNPAGLGYGTGAGGSVTQATSKATAVTLNKPCGTITLAADALASNTTARFSFTNSILAVTDTVILTIRNGVTAGAYLVWVDGTAAGSCTLAIRNISGGSLSDAVVLNFSIIKGVTA